MLNQVPVLAIALGMVEIDSTHYQQVIVFSKPSPMNNTLERDHFCGPFLLLTILCLFFSDVFVALNKYYTKNDLFIYISCIIEIPVYYFLLKYLLYREK